jgi:DNA-binding GntR family transcriptional regulator
LEREGLVRISPRLGLFVTEISIDAQLRLLEVRRVLERLMAARAARLCSEEQRQAFATIAGDMRGSGRSGDQFWFLELDLMFNRLLAETCGNEYAVASIALMGGQSRRFWFRYFRADTDLAVTCETHADVADAIASGSVDAAVAASEALMNYIEAFTRRVFVNLT